ncbi:MAG: PLP-dependent aminotransferase family protein [Anaerovoracaceae bacterium]
MNIELDKSSRTPIYMQIVDQIKSKIIMGEYPHGFTLASERELSRKLDVHRNTISKSYKFLKDIGLLKTVHGVSYEVDYQNNKYQTETNKSVVWENVIKAEYVNQEASFDKLFSKSYEKGNISFAGGISSLGVYTNENLSEAMNSIMVQGIKEGFFYSPYQGDLDLRRMLSVFFRKKGIVADEEHIQVLGESNQAIDYLIALLIKDGDRVITEATISPDVSRAIKLAGGIIITVPVDKDGMICENMEPLIQKYNPKFIYVNSSFSDPRGTVLSTKRRKEILELSYRYELPIIEDDEASELTFEAKKIPSLKSLDTGNNVIYIYNFSLSFVPGIGIASVAASKEIIEGLSYLVSIRLVSLDWLTQNLLKYFLESDIFYKKIEEFKRIYRSRRDLMCSYLEKLREYGITYYKPKGGVYIWCNFPENINVNELVKNGEKRGVSLMPGEVFYPEKSKKENYIRLNYSFSDEEEIKKGMEIIVDIVLEHLEDSK